jgi:hypothetical protein
MSNRSRDDIEFGQSNLLLNTRDDLSSKLQKACLMGHFCRRRFVEILISPRWLALIVG